MNSGERKGREGGSEDSDNRTVRRKHGEVKTVKAGNSDGGQYRVGSEDMDSEGMTIGHV